MDIPKHPISSASFIGHIFSLLVTQLKRREAFKTVSLIFVVLLCTIVRYIAVSNEESPLKKNNQTQFTVTNLKLPIWPPELILKSKKVKKQINYKLRLQDTKFTKTEKAYYSFLKD